MEYPEERMFASNLRKELLGIRDGFTIILPTIGGFFLEGKVLV